MNDNEHTELMSPEFSERVRAFKDSWYQTYKGISKEPTPEVDGTGRRIIDKRGDGKDYIIEPYMRERLDKYFPGWSSTMAAPLHFLGAEWVVAQVELSIVDEKLLAFNINPPIRKFYGTDAVRIQYKSGSDHVPENIVDIGDNCQSAVSGALKRAINRLTHIGDDIYGKRIEEEGAGSYETILETTGGAKSFMALLSKYRILASDACKMLAVEDLSKIEDYTQAWVKIKEIRGIK